MFTDPTGMIQDGVETDYTLNKDTGEIKQHVENNNQPDRIVEVKKDGEIKVKIDNIAKGILEDGMNLKTNDNLFIVDQENKPTKEEFFNFLSEFSTYVGKEIAGVGQMNLKTHKVNKYQMYRYNKNTRYESRIAESWLLSPSTKEHIHTHPYHNHIPSDYDIKLKNDYPNLNFYIISGGYEKKY